MRLTGERAWEVLAWALGEDPRRAPLGTPSVLSIAVGIDTVAFAPRVDVRAGAIEVGILADLEAGPSDAAIRGCLARAGAPAPSFPSLTPLVLAAWRAFARLEAIALRAEAALTGDEAAFGACDVFLDARALFRHPDLDALLEDIPARRLARAGIDYVGLDGDVGLLCIGAGMTLAMIDRLCDAGVRPAAFLDVSRANSVEGISLALETILDHHGARAIAVNVFGGITRMDLLARGLVEALARRGGARVPVGVRLEGTCGEAGRAVLAAAGIAVVETTAELVAFAARESAGGGA